MHGAVAVVDRGDLHCIHGRFGVIGHARELLVVRRNDLGHLVRKGLTHILLGKGQISKLVGHGIRDACWGIILNHEAPVSRRELLRRGVIRSLDLEAELSCFLISAIEDVRDGHGRRITQSCRCNGIIVYERRCSIRAALIGNRTVKLQNTVRILNLDGDDHVAAVVRHASPIGCRSILVRLEHIGAGALDGHGSEVEALGFAILQLAHGRSRRLGSRVAPEDDEVVSQSGARGHVTSGKRELEGLAVQGITAVQGLGAERHVVSVVGERQILGIVAVAEGYLGLGGRFLLDHTVHDLVIGLGNMHGGNPFDFLRRHHELNLILHRIVGHALIGVAVVGVGLSWDDLLEHVGVGVAHMVAGELDLLVVDEVADISDGEHAARSAVGHRSGTGVVADWVTPERKLAVADRVAARHVAVSGLVIVVLVRDGTGIDRACVERVHKLRHLVADVLIELVAAIVGGLDHRRGRGERAVAVIGHHNCD